MYFILFAFMLSEKVEEGITRIKDGSGASGRIESQGLLRNVDNFPANPNCDQVDIIE